jgi:hypothetical protein
MHIPSMAPVPAVMTARSSRRQMVSVVLELKCLVSRVTSATSTPDST